jgi:hypothetical protein
MLTDGDPEKIIEEGKIATALHDRFVVLKVIYR